MEGATGAVVSKAPTKKASSTVVRAPRASASAVTHKHKKAAIAVPVETAPAMTSGIAKPTGDDVAKLAYSYWESRGYHHGSPDEDWLRAERELKIRQ